MKTIISALILLAVIVLGFLFYVRHDSDNSTATSAATSTVTKVNIGQNTASTTGSTASSTAGIVSTGDIRITSPRSGQVVSSPLTVTGEARGNWFFEASAPVYVVNANGKKIAEGVINAQGDWMTTNFVPFKGTLTWSASSTGTSTKGSLIFMNDNPSGNPTLQKSVAVPVVFSR
jgi:hypothetical protein